MTVYAAHRNPDRAPIHPGELLSEIFPATGKTKIEIAALLGISRQHLYDIASEKRPISPVIAAKLGKLFGDGPAVWLKMQAAHDAWHASKTVDVSNIPTLRVA